MKRREFVQKISIGSLGSTLMQKSFTDPYQVESYDNDIECPINISIVAPSTILINKSFSVGIRILTSPYFTKWVPDWNRTYATVNGPFNKSPRGIQFMDNVLPIWEGEIHISGSDGFIGRSTYSFSEGKGPYQKDLRPIRIVGDFKFSVPGIKYIKVVEPESGIEVVSNAIRVSKDNMEEQLFWGDTHCHSIFGDGVRSPEELHAFARDEAFLDVFAHTEHTEAITDDQWDYFSAVANRFYEPGKYVTFIGGEWTSKSFGHRNFIYPGSKGPIIRSSDDGQNDLSKLFKIVSENNGLVVANHPSDPDFLIDFNACYHDPNVERLVEVYSVSGSHEKSFTNSTKHDLSKKSSVVDGIEIGHRMGMIGVGDTHDGRPGDALHNLQNEPERYKSLHKPGLTGIWSKNLTRESIFDALWNRRVYATTHHRTIVKFSINGAPMGSVINTKNELCLESEIASGLIIEKIELIRNGDVIETIFPSNKKYIFKRKIKNHQKSESWFYIKVSLEEYNYAWTSPIWINSVN